MRRVLIACAAVFLAAAMAAPLEAAGRPDVGALREALKGNKEDAVEAVSEAEPPVQEALVPALLRTYLHGPRVQAAQAASLLRNIGQRKARAVAPLVGRRFRESDEGDVASRLPLMELLRDLGPAAKPALAAVVEGLDSEDLNIRLQAVRAVSSIGPAAKEAVPALLEMLDVEGSLLREEAMRAVKITGARSSDVPKLVESLSSDRPGVQRFAIRVLADLGSQAGSAIPALIEKLETSEKNRRLNVIGALGAVGAADPAPVLAKLKEIMMKEGGASRSRAIRSIGEIGPGAEDAVPTLLGFAEGKGTALQELIQYSLDRIKTNNKPPVVDGIEARCVEGKSTAIRFPIRDDDDLPIALKAIIDEETARGRLRREGPRTFTYHCPPRTVTDQVFRWKATDGKAESEPLETRIEIEADKNPPGVRRVLTPGEKHLLVFFDEPVDPETAQVARNYELQSGSRIKSAGLREDGKSVLLVVQNPARKGEYRLTVEGVSDRARAGNLMQSKTFSFQYGVAEDFQQYDHGATPDEFHLWRTGKEYRSCRVDAKKFADRARGKVLEMKADAGTEWQKVLLREFKSPLTGRWRFAFSYWETNQNWCGDMWLLGTDGKPLIGAGTENPEWGIIIDEEHVVNDAENGDDYKHWIRVVMDVDTASNRARVTFRDTEDGTEKTYGWFELRDVEGISAVGIGPNIGWHVDDIRISPAGGGMEKNR